MFHAFILERVEQYSKMSTVPRAEKRTRGTMHTFKHESNVFLQRKLGIVHVLVVPFRNEIVSILDGVEDNVSTQIRVATTRAHTSVPRVIFFRELHDILTRRFEREAAYKNFNALRKAEIDRGLRCVRNVGHDFLLNDLKLTVDLMLG